MSLAQQKTLGISLSGNTILYAVNAVGTGSAIQRIGQASFQFPVMETIVSDPDAKLSVQSVLKHIIQDYSCNQVRIVTDFSYETWLSVPKAVYDEPTERDAYLSAFTNSSDRSSVEPFWFPLSNREFRMLALRNRKKSLLLEELVAPVVVVDHISDFELGIRWALHSKSKGSYLTLHFQENKLVVSSFILGKLRGATFFTFQHDDDLPFLWLQNAQFLHWMRGIHDFVYLFGTNSKDRTLLLKPYIDPSVSLVHLNSPEKMQVETDDKTYGFDVSEAWPAVLAALEV